MPVVAALLVAVCVLVSGGATAVAGHTSDGGVSQGMSGQAGQASHAAAGRSHLLQAGTALPPQSDEEHFRRFRLDTVDGARLSPNRDDLAARTSARGPLLVFLPATRAQPSDYTQFLSAATNAGYHVIGLDYWNLGRTLSRTCAGREQCYTLVQRNRFDGTAASPYSRVQAAGSIVSRLRNAIEHLADVDPTGRWGRFVRHGDVQWRDIVIAGHSQGGSEAAFIGHIRPVRGVLMFGAPAVSLGDRHASWINRRGVTPTSREYAFASVDDEYGPFIRPSWRAMALPGARAPFITRNAAPIDDPHVIETTLAVPAGDTAHSIVVSDDTPRDALGNPVLLPVWRWLLTRFAAPATGNEAAPAGS